MLTINLKINNREVGPYQVPPDLMMIQFLHEYVNLTGTKFGCGIGVCHACVIVEKDESKNSYQTYRSCITGVSQFKDKSIYTVEGHARVNERSGLLELHPVQQVFIEEFAFQCGWCTPGFVNQSIVFYEQCRQHPIAPSQVESAIEATLNNHLCRCTGYIRYFSALKKLILSTPGLTIT
jgi:aerobic-type carbon monoxide dehydrogenase small subunit (CoxS/CutS family)